MKANEFREFAARLGFDVGAVRAKTILDAATIERKMLVELCDRYYTGEVLLRPELTERRGREDETPVIDVIKLKRKFKDGYRVPFVRREQERDGWMIVGGRTIIWRRNRRFEIGRELELYEGVFLWDERKVIWTDGLLK